MEVRQDLYYSFIFVFFFVKINVVLLFVTMKHEKNQKIFFLIFQEFVFRVHMTLHSLCFNPVEYIANALCVKLKDHRNHQVGSTAKKF